MSAPDPNGGAQNLTVAELHAASGLGFTDLLDDELFGTDDPNNLDNDATPWEVALPKEALS